MDLPSVSVVVTTCAMPELAARCVASIMGGEQQPLEVIVVENRPGRATTAATLQAAFPGDPAVRCVEQRVRGLSAARNCGLGHARGEVVAFTDDDVVVDPGWVGAVATAFARSPSVACVTGPILALELETEVQLLFEQFARLSKGFERRVYTADRPPPGDPLFPYAAGRFGSGANTAVRAGLARDLGGFDTHLGAGTPARGGEDLDLFIRVLRAGGTIAYEPGAVLRHAHPRSWRSLREHAFGYGVGLTAMLTKQLAIGGDPLALLQRAPRGLRYAFDPGSDRNASKGADYPAELNRLERLGMAFGPAAYAVSRLRARAGEAA